MHQAHGNVHINLFMQILSTGDPFVPNTWYEVELMDLGMGSLGFQIIVSNQTVPYSSTDFTGVDFTNFDGPLYIGGHPSFSTIPVSYFQCPDPGGWVGSEDLDVVVNVTLKVEVAVQILLGA